jgi:hypothetical protein
MRGCESSPAQPIAVGLAENAMIEQVVFKGSKDYVQESISSPGWIVSFDRKCGSIFCTIHEPLSLE